MERLFISSVQKELAEERRAVRDYVHGDALLRRFFGKTKYIERMGTGTGDMIRRCREAGLDEPQFALTDGFVATIHRKPERAFQAVGGAIAVPGTRRISDHIASEVTQEAQERLTHEGHPTRPVRTQNSASTPPVTGPVSEGDYYQNGRRCWIRLHETGGKFHEVPAHHSAEASVDAYL